MHTNIITPSKDYVTQSIHAATNNTHALANTQYAGYSIITTKRSTCCNFFLHTATVCLMNVEFNKFHWSIFITINIITTNTSFNIVSRGLWQLFTEPWSRHSGWIAQLTAGRRRTPFTIPEGVIVECGRGTSTNRVPTLTKQVISNKGGNTC